MTLSEPNLYKVEAKIVRVCSERRVEILSRRRLVIFVVVISALLTIGAVVAVVGDPAGRMTAYYYGTVIDYEQLAAERAEAGEFVYCTARPSTDLRATETILDCYDTIEEADQKLLEYRPDLADVLSGHEVSGAEAAKPASKMAMLSCSADITLHYNASYDTPIPGFIGICWSVDPANVNTYSHWINGIACVRFWQFSGETGNHVNVCQTYWYFYYGVGSLQWLG